MVGDAEVYAVHLLSSRSLTYPDRTVSPASPRCSTFVTWSPRSPPSRCMAAAPSTPERRWPAWLGAARRSSRSSSPSPSSGPPRADTLLRRHGHGSAIGYVALRTLEATVILTGVVAILPAVARPATTGRLGPRARGRCRAAAARLDLPRRPGADQPLPNVVVLAVPPVPPAAGRPVHPRARHRRAAPRPEMNVTAFFGLMTSNPLGHTRCSRGRSRWPPTCVPQGLRPHLPLDPRRGWDRGWDRWLGPGLRPGWRSPAAAVAAG